MKAARVRHAAVLMFHTVSAFVTAVFYRVKLHLTRLCSCCYEFLDYFALFDLTG